jgi:peptidoglycan/LPS O-acetylase OafA/YrhL
VSATNPVFAIVAVGISIVTAWILARVSPPPALKRYDALDGLRGLLAVLVMINHAAAWWQFARTGEWTLLSSRLYAHFGQSSVALFFMITAFLFGSKLVDGRVRPIAWPRLYVSRVLRLVPLYLCFVALLAVLSLVTSGFALRESVLRFGLNIGHWLAFTVVDMPAINRFPAPIVGGAAWSLVFEWWFYLALPFLGVLLGTRRESGWLITASALSTLVAAFWITSRGSWSIAALFLGGWPAVFLVRRPRLQALIWRPVCAIVALAALAAATRPPPFALQSTLLLAVAFGIVASGNTLFGALTSAPLRVLGEMGYSVYLLHGILLYVAFSGIGLDRVSAFSPVQHWAVVWATVPVLLCVCRLTFRTIEAPAMAAVDRTTARLRTMLGRAPAASGVSRTSSFFF